MGSSKRYNNLMEITELEGTIRENIFVSNKIAEKLDFIRNKLILLYGKDVTLGEVEEIFWSQYLKCQDKIHKVFENVK